MPTGARISFGVYDETAKDEASYYAASGSAQSWVDYSEIKDGLSPDENPDEFGRYISGEPGVYRLDGSSRLFPGTRRLPPGVLVCIHVRVKQAVPNVPRAVLWVCVASYLYWDHHPLRRHHPPIRIHGAVVV